MKVVVVGRTGLIGSKAVAKLSAHGHTVVAAPGGVLRGPAIDSLMTYRAVVDGDFGRVETRSTEA